MPFTSLPASSDRVALREGDRLVDRDLGRHLAAVELGIATRSALRSTAPSRSAVQPSEAAVIRSSSSGAFAATSSASARAHGSISPSYCEPISGAGEVPLVEEHQRLPAGLAARDHASSSKRDVDRDVEVARLLQRRRDRLLTRARPAPRAARRAGGQLEPDDARLDVDRALAPHAQPVDALGGARGDPSSTESGTVIVPCGPVERRAASPANLRDGRAQLGQRRGRVAAAAELLAAEHRRARTRASSGRPRSPSPRARAPRARSPPARSASHTTSFAISES